MVTPNPSAPGRIFSSRGLGRKRVAVVAVVVVILVAAVGTVWWYGASQGQSGPALHPGLATGLDALSAVEERLANMGTQSWLVLSDIGVATNVAFTPWILGGDPGNLSQELETIWTCGVLPLPSIWNASAVPAARTGNITDGYAPFWQFVFANETSSKQWVFAIGSYVNGSAAVAGPLSQTDPCILDLGLGPGFEMFSPAFPNLPTDVGGPLAYSYVRSLGGDFGPYAALWMDGYPLIANAGVDSFFGPVPGNMWQVTFYACGLSSGPPTPLSVVAGFAAVWSQQGQPTSAGLGSTTGNCTFASYSLFGSAMPVHLLGSGTAFQIDLTVNATGSAPYGPDAQGLSAWMLPAGLSDRNGTPIPATTNLCPGPVSSIASCPLPATGWYGVLLSPSGQWLDSYGTLSGSASWAVPNVPLLTDESLAILAAGSNVTQNSTLRFLPQTDWPT